MIEFKQVHENEEDQAVSLSKEAKCFLLLDYAIYKKYKTPRNTKFYNYHYHIQDIKNILNIKMSTCIGIIGSFLVIQLLQKSLE